MTLTVVHSSVQKRENPPSFDEGLPKIVNLAGDSHPHTTGLIRRQHLTGRYNLHPTFALIAATLIYGEIE